MQEAIFDAGRYATFGSKFPQAVKVIRELLDEPAKGKSFLGPTLLRLFKQAFPYAR